MDGSASAIDEILKYRSKDFRFKAVAALDDSFGGGGVRGRARVGGNDVGAEPRHG